MQGYTSRIKLHDSFGEQIVGVGAIVRRTATIILKGYTEYLRQCILVPKTICFSFCDDSFLIFSYAYAWQSYDASFFYHKALLNKFFCCFK